MSQVSVEQLTAMARDQVPMVGQLGLIVETLGDGEARVRCPFRDDFLRPGGTISGPVMMTMADYAMYAAVLSRIGMVELAVTTNLNINFLRRPRPGDVLAEAKLLKLGQRLAVGEIALHVDNEEDLVAHVTATYSIPPRNT
ncbi:MAG: PaaI family thioesterase [Gammaproteobacteria bacterium]|nr:PaaI family thioesterase [Gammaproteobacteria bacterium]